MKFEQENFHSAIFTNYLADEQKFSARICQLRIFLRHARKFHSFHFPSR
jgi:hypothetical protein